MPPHPLKSEIAFKVPSSSGLIGRSNDEHAHWHFIQFSASKRLTEPFGRSASPLANCLLQRVVKHNNLGAVAQCAWCRMENLVGPEGLEPSTNGLRVSGEVE
jgi:hypothetical protein